MMGRKRKPENQWMPAKVSLKKNRYVLSGYQGSKEGKPNWGKEITLCSGDASKAEVWQRYEEVQGIGTALTLDKLMNEFNRSPHFKTLAPRTQKDYLRYYDIITNKELKNGVFGDLLVEKMTPGIIRKYLDRRSTENAPIAGNKETSYISSAFGWAYQRDKVSGVNPCDKVTRNPAPPRQHYVWDKDYYAFLMMDTKPFHVNIVSELMYLCRLRENEVLSITRAQLIPEGFDAQRGKGSKNSIIPMSDRLQAVIDACLKLPLSITPIRPQELPLIHDKQGMAITQSAFYSAWKRRMKKFVGEPFTPHDLKRKAVSDFTGDKLKASGHNDPKMLKVYDVRPDTVKPTR